MTRGDHNAIWTPPNVRRKLAEAKSSSAFCYKTSVRRAARGENGIELWQGHSRHRRHGIAIDNRSRGVERAEINKAPRGRWQRDRRQLQSRKMVTCAIIDGYWELQWRLHNLVLVSLICRMIF